MKEKLENLFKEKGLVFYQREIDGGTIYILPYELVKQGVQFDIKMILEEQSSSLKIGFDCKKGTGAGISDRLLEINAELKDGVLSIGQDADMLSFRLNIIIGTDFEWEIYRDYLYRCFAVFMRLYNESLIDNEEYRSEKSDEK